MSLVAEQTVQRSDLPDQTVQEADSNIKKYTREVKGRVSVVVAGSEVDGGRNFAKFEATHYIVATPPRTVGSTWYIAKVDIGEGDDKFLHVKLNVPVIPNPTASFMQVALYYNKDAPITNF